jgi:hypothetical protein
MAQKNCPDRVFTESGQSLILIDFKVTCRIHVQLKSKEMLTSMSLYRIEFNKAIIRLKLIKDELLEQEFNQTAGNLNEAIVLLNQADKSYIQELADKKSKAMNKTKPQT